MDNNQMDNNQLENNTLEGNQAEDNQAEAAPQTTQTAASLFPEREALKKKTWLSRIIVGVMLAVFGIAMILTMPFSAVDFNTVSYKDMEKGTVYYSDEIYIVDVYASDEEETEFYFLAIAFDKNEEYGLFSITTDDAALIEEWMAYANSEETMIGDLYLSGYFAVESWPTNLLNLDTYYRESAVDYSEVLYCEDTGLYAVYVCDEGESLLTNYHVGDKVFYLAIIAIGVILGVWGFVEYKKQKREEAEARRAEHPGVFSGEF
ncbi:MAG: hypothetical protein IJV98_03655 [Clostridia bacterium]|nr:hypothetical protein [Clostridia bacterium]